MSAWSTRLEVLFLHGCVLLDQLSTLSSLRSLTLGLCVVVPSTLDLRACCALESCTIDMFGHLALGLPSAVRELQLRGIRLSPDIFSRRLRLDGGHSLTRLVLVGYVTPSESDEVLVLESQPEFPNVQDFGLYVRQAFYGANWAEFLASSVGPSSVRRLELDVSESHVYDLLTRFRRVSDLKLRLDCEAARWDSVLAHVRDQLVGTLTRLDISGAMLNEGARVMPPGLRQALLYFCVAGKVLVPAPSELARTASCSFESVRQAVWPWPK